ncbi:DUF6701 domain-containing protein [Vibrio owensii]|uniref:DUF6701 domain-containing protein n=1 Tax=Vibrio owensii TaxID=696485 RepID=UPI0003A64940|nr:DUF6701 domain-containing protein [Vibrio owensii]
MMRFISLLGTALLFPVYGQATTYDVADLTQLNAICSSASGFTIENGGTTYSCSGKIELPVGHAIISSLPTARITLKSHAGMTFEGNNQIGSADKPIDLTVPAAAIKVLNQDANNIDDYRAKHSIIFGNLKASYPMSIKNLLLKGKIDLTGSALTVNGQYNSITGDIVTHSTTKLTNTNVCGNVESNGHLFKMDTLNSLTKHYVVGDIVAHSTLELDGVTAYGTIQSKGASATIGGAVYDTDTSVKYFQTLNFLDDTELCGDVLKLPAVPGFSQIINGSPQRYCGIGLSSCDYASDVCPITAEDIPVCSMLPPTDDDFDLVVTPTEDMALMCGDELPKFTVTTTNNGEVTSAQVLASLSHPDLFILEMVEGKQKIDDSNFISKDDGTLVIKVVPNDINAISLDVNYTLSFTMVDDINKAQTVQFMFTPYMFEAYAEDLSSLKEIHVIAGKSQTVDTRLLACATTGEQVIATNYDGKPQVTHPLIKPVGGNEGNFSYSAEFKDGLSSHGLITNESGLFSVRLFDTFKCTGFQECPDEGSVEVEGTFNVKSRPWTLAICDGSTTLASGTSESGPGFIAAGEHFSLTVKPIVWQSGGSLSGEVNTESYCGTDVTQNFMLKDAPAASIVLSSKQKTPTETADQSEKLLESTLSLTRSHTESENSQYTFSSLYWEEVGSLKIKAKLDSQYLDMTVNTGYRNVGRFYAKYFKVREAEWTYPTKQDFIYMNQPFERVSYDVVALNAKKEDIQNYVHFNASLREHLHLGELSNYVNRFIPPPANSVEWNLVGDASVGTFTIEKASGNATCDNSPCWEKDETNGNYPDGPFNKDSKSTQSEIGLIHTNVVDEIHFFDDRHILEQQPDVRFGRLNFKDVGGNQGMTIKVPLDVEVWQDGRFVTHFEDSATTANGEHHTRTPIWSNSPADNTLLSGEGTMLAGRTYDIVASQVDSAREQVRFDLDLSSAGNNLPWLKYNWDKSDADEDNPPTVVTFGIHRGNDRIIYRGEPNFIGMN